MKKIKFDNKPFIDVRAITPAKEIELIVSTSE